MVIVVGIPFCSVGDDSVGVVSCVGWCRFIVSVWLSGVGVGLTFVVGTVVVVDTVFVSGVVVIWLRLSGIDVGLIFVVGTVFVSGVVVIGLLVAGVSVGVLHISGVMGWILMQVVGVAGTISGPRSSSIVSRATFDMFCVVLLRNERISQCGMQKCSVMIW